MEESGSQFHQTKFNLGFPYNNTDLKNPYSFEDSTSRNFPSFPFNFGQKCSPTVGTAPTSQKRFLIFDQSGDKTTLIYSPGVEYETNWMPKPPITRNFLNERKTMNDEQKDDNSSEDEMREDTEELNALLCDSDFTEDDEETSTGHSPSTMTDNGTRKFVEEIGEEVDSFSGTIKRRKLPEGSCTCDVPSQMGTSKSSSLEDNLSTQVLGKRKERILETVSVLQRLFPSAEGKDAIDVIDEAICYLRSLKDKATAL